MNINYIDDLFYVINKDTYPPFKNGYYMEEYFYNYMKTNNLNYDKEGRLYIPVLWTNFQIEPWFNIRKEYMQNKLNEYIDKYKCEKGYFTIVQYDDGPLLKLPENTKIYGACSGTDILPLIYEDNIGHLLNLNKKTFSEKKILCSFVGSNTNNVRNIIEDKYKNSSNFKFIIRNYWSPVVVENEKNNFIETTLNSKFALAPRGYGRSSFRFFEIFKLNTIPIYVWDDIEWLPYRDMIDYSKICIGLHISRINELENILLNIGEEQYNNMLNNYNKIKYMFELEFMCKYIMGNINEFKISLCIPTMDRFDTFLSENLKKYIKYLNRNIIDEIIINDENGNDYEKLKNTYGNIKNLNIYKNESRLGVFKNKLKVCSYAKNNFVALIDSDNFCDENYFIKVRKYIIMNQISEYSILSPSFAKPSFNYTSFNNLIITKDNLKKYKHYFNFDVLMNTGNYVITKDIIDNIKYDVDTNLISACDVLYFNILSFQQFPKVKFHIIKNLEYEHVVHDGSTYLTTINQCNSFINSVVIPTYNSL